MGFLMEQLSDVVLGKAVDSILVSGKLHTAEVHDEAIRDEIANAAVPAQSINSSLELEMVVFLPCRQLRVNAEGVSSLYRLAKLVLTYVITENQ